MQVDSESADLHDDEADQQPLYLAFKVADEGYVVPVGAVAEVIRVPKIVPVPDVPDYIPGVINLRGRVIPVIHLAGRFGLTDKSDPGRRVIVVVQGAGEQTGFLVDQVQRVIAIGDDHVERTAIGQRNGVLHGVATTESADYLILDAQRLIDECQRDEESST